MNSSISFQKIHDSLVQFLKRFHLVLSILVIAGSLAFAIFMLNALIARSQEDGTPTPSAQFDTETIERIRKLQTRNDDTNFNLPSGRINPFVE